MVDYSDSSADKSKKIPLSHRTRKNFFLHVWQKNLLAHIKKKKKKKNRKKTTKHKNVNKNKNNND